MNATLAHPASRRLAAIAAMLFAAAMGAAAAGPIPAQLEPGPAATVRAVVDGDTVVLGDRSQVRLVGLQAPKLPLGRAGFPVWPLAPEAKAALESQGLSGPFIARRRHCSLRGLTT